MEFLGHVAAQVVFSHSAGTYPHACMWIKLFVSTSLAYEANFHRSLCSSHTSSTTVVVSHISSTTVVVSHTSSTTVAAVARPYAVRVPLFPASTRPWALSGPSSCVASACPQSLRRCKSKAAPQRPHTGDIFISCLVEPNSAPCTNTYRLTSQEKTACACSTDSQTCHYPHRH